MQGSAEDWLRQGAEAIFSQAGLRTDVEGKPVLRLQVDQIFTDEKVVHRAEFDGRVVLTAELSPAGDGTACRSLRVDGFAENYGYAGKLENYHETLNHALDRALLKLVASHEFQTQLCAGCPLGLRHPRKPS